MALQLCVSIKFALLVILSIDLLESVIVILFSKIIFVVSPQKGSGEKQHYVSGDE
jgi:hypothetical protein